MTPTNRFRFQANVQPYGTGATSSHEIGYVRRQAHKQIVETIVEKLLNDNPFTDEQIAAGKGETGGSFCIKEELRPDVFTLGYRYYAEVRFLETNCYTVEVKSVTAETRHFSDTGKKSIWGKLKACWGYLQDNRGDLLISEKKRTGGTKR